MTQEKIKPKKIKGEKESYILEDKDYLLINAIRDLTEQIKKLNSITLKNK